MAKTCVFWQFFLPFFAWLYLCSQESWGHQGVGRLGCLRNSLHMRACTIQFFRRRVSFLTFLSSSQKGVSPSLQKAQGSPVSMVPLGFPNSLGVPQVIKIGDDFSKPPLGDFVFSMQETQLQAKTGGKNPENQGPLFGVNLNSATCHFLANGGGFQACSGHGKTIYGSGAGWLKGMFTDVHQQTCSLSNRQSGTSPTTSSIFCQ